MCILSVKLISFMFCVLKFKTTKRWAYVVHGLNKVNPPTYQKKWQKNKTCLSSSNGCRADLSVGSSILKKLRQVHRKFTSAFLSYDNPFMSVSQPPTASQQQKGSNLHFILNVYIKPAQYLMQPLLALRLSYSLCKNSQHN